MRKLSIKFLLIYLTAFTVGQELNCEYEDTSDFGEGAKKTFTCRLRINNPNGFDDFDRISGNHDNEVNAIEKTIGITSIIPSILCKQFENLEILSLAEKEIEVVSKEALQSCINLGALYLSNNKINKIHRDAFESLRNLRYLDLDGNQLEELPEDVFRAFGNLEWLTISNNPLHDIQSDVFKSLKSLQYLYLSGCGIVDVKHDWFIASPKLLYLELSNNKIDELPPAVFASSTNLRHLVMANNQLKVLNSDSFDTSSLANLKSLSFNGNTLEAIDPDIFNAATNLKTARFYKNVCVDEVIQVEASIKGKIVNHDDKFWKFDDCFLNFEMTVKKKAMKDEL